MYDEIQGIRGCESILSRFYVLKETAKLIYRWSAPFASVMSCTTTELHLRHVATQTMLMLPGNETGWSVHRALDQRLRLRLEGLND
jgi:hypothetical protein